MNCGFPDASMNYSRRKQVRNNAVVVVVVVVVVFVVAARSRGEGGVSRSGFVVV